MQQTVLLSNITSWPFCHAWRISEHTLEKIGFNVFPAAKFQGQIAFSLFHTLCQGISCLTSYHSPLETGFRKRKSGLPITFLWEKPILNFRICTTSYHHFNAPRFFLWCLSPGPPSFFFIGTWDSNRLGKQDQSNQLLQFHNESSVLEDCSSALLGKLETPHPKWEFQHPGKSIGGKMFHPSCFGGCIRFPPKKKCWNHHLYCFLVYKILELEWTYKTSL